VNAGNGHPVADKRVTPGLEKRGLIEWRGLPMTGGYVLTDAGRNAVAAEFPVEWGPAGEHRPGIYEPKNASSTFYIWQDDERQRWILKSYGGGPYGTDLRAGSLEGAFKLAQEYVAIEILRSSDISGDPANPQAGDVLSGSEEFWSSAPAGTRIRRYRGRGRDEWTKDADSGNWMSGRHGCIGDETIAQFRTRYKILEWPAVREEVAA